MYIYIYIYFFNTILYKLKSQQSVSFRSIYIYIYTMYIYFLDVTFNLKSGKYWPHRKPNDQPLYVHHYSNHPRAVKKQLRSMLADRLLSYNREEFTRAIPKYKEAIRRTGYSGELQYISPPSSHKRKPRKRNIV